MKINMVDNRWLVGACTAVAVIALSTQCADVAHAASAGFGTYSEGNRMGQITKFSVKGYMTKSGEGQMLMGREGTPYIIHGTDSEGKSTKKTINPWYFSADLKKSDLVNEWAGQ